MKVSCSTQVDPKRHGSFILFDFVACSAAAALLSCVAQSLSGDHDVLYDSPCAASAAWMVLVVYI